MLRRFTAIVEKDPETGYYVGYIPGFSGAHSQADSLDELQKTCAKLSRCFSKMASLSLKPNLLAYRKSC